MSAKRPLLNISSWSKQRYYPRNYHTTAKRSFSAFHPPPGRTKPSAWPFRLQQPLAARLVRHNATKAAGGDALLRTPLNDLHVAHGAKIVPFGGYLMPVQYNDLTLVESHNWTREKASLFDVSHM